MLNMAKNLPYQDPQKILDLIAQFVIIGILIISPCLFGSMDIIPQTIIILSAFFILFLGMFKFINQGFIEFVQLPLNRFILLFLAYICIQYIFIGFFLRDFTLGDVYRKKMMYETIKLISYLVFFYTVVINFKNRRTAVRVIHLLIFIGLSLAVIGVIQKLGGAEKIFWISSKGRKGAMFSVFPNRSHFASYMNMIIFLSLGFIFSLFPSLRDQMHAGYKKDFAKILLFSFQKGIGFYIFALIIMVSSVFYSVSRGGMLSFMCGVIFFSILISVKGFTRKGYIALVIILALITAVLFWIKAPDDITRRFLAMKNPKATLSENILGDRKVMAATAVNMLTAYSITGVGFGAFEYIYNGKYNPELFDLGNHLGNRFYIDYLHDDFLQLFCEVGTVGFVIFLIAAFSYFFNVLKTVLRRHDPFAVGIGIGGLSGLVSMCVHSFLDFNFHIPSNAVLFFIIAALTLVSANSEMRHQTETSLLPRKQIPICKARIGKIAALTILLIMFLYTAKIFVARGIACGIADEQESIENLSRYVKLEPSNDNYHFILGSLYARQAVLKRDASKIYLANAIREVKEAISINPWSEEYKEYQGWLTKILVPKLLGAKHVP